MSEDTGKGEAGWVRWFEDEIEEECRMIFRLSKLTRNLNASKSLGLPFIARKRHQRR